jgi:hypothetical protein
VFSENAWELEQRSRIALLCVMVAGSFMVVALPHLVAYVRYVRALYSHAAALDKLIVLINSKEDFRNLFEPADYHAINGWTAWHPSVERWQNDKVWTDLVPVVYLNWATGLSVIVPLSWSSFLAWKLSDDISAGTQLPFHGPQETTFCVNSIHRLCGRCNWSVIRADFDVSDSCPVAA